MSMYPYITLDHQDNQKRAECMSLPVSLATPICEPVRPPYAFGYVHLHPYAIRHASACGDDGD